MENESSNEALKLWQAVPSDIRRMLLSNVWCGECRKSVTTVDYRQMKQMFFEKPPSFEQILERLRVVEEKINGT